jgi:hypothetical protein
MAEHKITLKQEKLRKVSQMGFSSAQLRNLTPKAKALTVRDLEDLADAFAGLEIINPEVRALKVEDISSLEQVFRAQRDAALERVVRAGDLAATDIDVSCCCCTPCCCCAAADVDPFTQ